ncbi:hypothetical protein MP638_006503 [Amoeboaphelidium occidentale]|nr:hypothetical protein MP638_006503 [Amoeboaphelidium occidentale]
MQVFLKMFGIKTKTVKTYGRRQQRKIIIEPQEKRLSPFKEVVYSFHQDHSSSSSESETADDDQYGSPERKQIINGSLQKIFSDEPINISTPLISKLNGPSVDDFVYDSSDDEDNEQSALLQPPVQDDDILDLTKSLGDRLSIKPDSMERDITADLLELCDQDHVVDFTEFLSSIWADQRKGKKLGEATFSEVFLLPLIYPAGSVSVKQTSMETVVKIIPIRDDMTSMENFHQEVFITKTLSGLPGSNFVTFYGAALVQGSYPKKLLKLWDRWAKSHDSENHRPDIFSEDQMYGILLLEYGGITLENSYLENWDQAVSVVRQITLSLAVAEQELKYEHRDLHWGNVLLRGEDIETIVYKVGDTTHEVTTHGITVSIIDYTFSRLQDCNSVIFRAFDDDEYFTGEGDYQFEIYRKMRAEVSNNWRKYEPRTNILWLHYLIQKIIEGDIVQNKAKRSMKAKANLIVLYHDINEFSSVNSLLKHPFFEEQTAII